MKRVILSLSLIVLLAIGGFSFAEETAQPANATQTVETAPEGPVTIAYYFYNTIRCKSCLAIESMSHAVIETDFADDVAGGKLVWQMKNLDEDENAHFIDDYKLYTKSLVLVEYQNGEQTRWKNCTRVWELLNDETKFKQYVHDEVAAFLAKQ